MQKQHSEKVRLAFIVSHPIQYYVPLYQRLTIRSDVDVKVFFTWHVAENPTTDRGFGLPIAWDIPVTSGYDYELIPNTSRDPGTHHFFGLANPGLVDAVLSWRPDVVHVTGWGWWSHFLALRAFHVKKVTTFLRGDSHLLDETRHGLRWRCKQILLRQVLSWPSGCLFVGSANRQYYETFGVPPDRLHYCPHSVDVGRFLEPDLLFRREAAEWRTDLGIGDDQCVILFAGKFEGRKCPLELMRAVRNTRNDKVVMVMVGAGELESEVREMAATDPERFRVLPFQNQSRMPIVYRLGDLFVLPSAHGETWGLAMNEALACGCPVLASDRVGGAVDVLDRSCGRIFLSGNFDELTKSLAEMTISRSKLLSMRSMAEKRAWLFDIARTEEALMAAVIEKCAA